MDPKLTKSIEAYLRRYNKGVLYLILILFGIKPSRSLIAKNLLDSNSIPQNALSWFRPIGLSVKAAIAIAINENFRRRKIQILVNLIFYWKRKKSYLLHPAFVRLSLFEIEKHSNALKYIRNDWKKRFEIEKIDFNFSKSKKLENVLVDESGIVWSEPENRLFYSDETSSPRNPFVAGQWDKVAGYENSQHAYINDLVLKKPYILGEKAEYLDLRVRASSNYWHSLIIGGSKLFYATKSIPDHPDTAILASDEVPSSVKEAYSVIGAANKITYIKKDFNIKVKKLILIEDQVSVFDSCLRKPENNVKFNFSMLSAMSSEILNVFNGDKDYGKLPDKIFVWRTGSWRNADNQEKLASQLSDLGYEIIDPLSMTFQSQVMYFNRAKIIVGISGAAWANLMFCAPGARIISVRSELMAPWDMHERVAESFGLHYKAYNVKSKSLSGKYRPLQYRNAIHEDLEFSRDTIKKIISLAIS
jgi:hypothetical protein